MKPTELETDVHRELAQLPAPRAPKTLRPRVLSAARRLMERPWYERPWSAWPWRYRVVSVATWIGVLAGLGTVVPRVDTAAGAVWSVLMEGASRIEAWVSLAAVPMTVAGALWRAVPGPLAGYVVALVVMAGAVGALCGAALTRVAAGEEWSS